jgi:hypothetical protein
MNRMNSTVGWLVTTLAQRLVWSSTGSAVSSQTTWQLVHPAGVSTSETDTRRQRCRPAIWYS